MPVQAVAVTFPVQQQQQQKDGQVSRAVLATTLLPSRWGEGERGYKTPWCRNLCNTIAVVEGAYLCLRLLIFRCTSACPFAINHSSPTTQFLSCSYHQAHDSSEIRAPHLPHSPPPSTHINFPPTVLPDYFAAHKADEGRWTLKAQAPASFTASHSSFALKWGCLNLLFFQLSRHTPRVL